MKEKKNELIRKGACIFLLNLLNSRRDEATGLAVKLSENISKQPKFAETINYLLFDSVQTFIKYFYLIVTREINVVLLLLNNTIEYFPQVYSNMESFYNVVFTDAGNINNAIQYDDTAMFAMYKKNVLIDVEMWLKWHYEETKAMQIIDRYIYNVEYLPIVITMIWVIFENKKYKRILGNLILVDHFEFADCFPVFFKYMISIVNYNHQKVPLFALIIGILLNDISALHRELCKYKNIK